MLIHENQENYTILVKGMNVRQQLAIYDIVENQAPTSVRFVEDTIMIHVSSQGKFDGLKESLNLVRVGLKDKSKEIYIAPIDDLEILMNTFEQQADRMIELKGISYDTKLSTEQEMEMKLCEYEIDSLKRTISKYMKIS